MHKERTINTETVATGNMAARLPAVVALMFGVFLVFGAAFAQMPAAHNAAHDVRHAFSVPCH